MNDNQGQKLEVASSRSRQRQVIAYRLICLALFAVNLLRLAFSGAVISLALLGLPVLLGLALRKPRHVDAWVAFVAVLSAFFLLRTVADDTGIPWQASYALAADRWIGLGILPSSRLQAFSLPWIDRLATYVYSAFFLVPPVAGLATWRYPDVLERYVRAVFVVTAGALVVHFAVPTIPPWLATVRGLVHEPLRRIAWEVLNPSAPALVESARHASANDVAAMPSVHVALSVIAALGLGRSHRLAGALGWVYASAISLAVIYLGEHYAVDVVAGAALAAVAWAYSARQRTQVLRTRPAKIIVRGIAPPLPEL